MTGRLAQRRIGHVVPLDAAREAGRDVVQRDHRMPPLPLGQVVDEVDDAVLQPADVEPEEHVRDQRPRILRRAHRAAVSAQRGLDRRTHVAGELAQGCDLAWLAVLIGRSRRSRPTPRCRRRNSRRFSASRAFASTSLVVTWPSTQYHCQTTSASRRPARQHAVHRRPSHGRGVRARPRRSSTACGSSDTSRSDELTSSLSCDWLR